MDTDLEKRYTLKSEESVQGDESDSSTLGKDVLSQEHLDPAMNAKMHLVNNVSRLRAV